MPEDPVNDAVVGGLAILGMYWARDFNTFFGLMLVHSLLYVPTISVSNWPRPKTKTTPRTRTRSA